MMKRWRGLASFVGIERYSTSIRRASRMPPLNQRLMRDRQETRRASVKRTNANALRRLGLLVACMLLAAGCTTAPPRPTGREPAEAPRPATGRQASEAEMRALALAVMPLLEELNFPMPRSPDDCRVGLIVLPSAAINAAAGPGSQKPCTLFTLGVS